MKAGTRTAIDLVLAFVLIVAWLMFATGQAYATPPDNRPPDNRPPDRTGGPVSVETQSESEANASSESSSTATSTSHAEGGIGGAGGEGGAGGSAESSSHIGDTTAAGGSAEASGGSVGDININNGDTIPANTTHKAKIKIENTPDIVTITPGSGDNCKAHIGANVSIPGLGTGLNIPLPGKECRKLKYYDRMVAMGDLNAAEIIFCSLKEVATEFRQLDLDCRDTLSIYAEPIANFNEPQLLEESVVVAEAWSADQLVAQLSDEQYEELRTQIEETDEEYEEQRTIIKSQADELARLKREAERLKAEQAARKAAEAASQAKFKARLAAKGE
jgi:hypothetical protein